MDERAACARGFWFTGTILLIVFFFSATQAWPSDSAPVPVRTVALPLSAIWPQHWAFFAAEPQADIDVAYAVDGSGRTNALNLGPSAPGNDYGFGRSELGRFVEISVLADAVPATAWLTCGAATPFDCMKADLLEPAVVVADVAPTQTLCGHLLVAVESPLRWTDDTRLWLENWKVLEVANIEATCEHD